VEVLRRLRNATRDGFSTDTSEISPEVQRAWWVAMRGRVKAWLYLHETDVVGFGVLRQTEDGRWWTSVGVLEHHRGHGYGGAITTDLAARSASPVWATARLDNPAAQRLHREAIWEEIDRDERLVYYMTRPSVHHSALYDEIIGRAAEAGWNAVGIS
jgi:GNAT superfamily N-acetyltransferase